MVLICPVKKISQHNQTRLRKTQRQLLKAELPVKLSASDRVRTESMNGSEAARLMAIVLRRDIMSVKSITSSSGKIKRPAFR
jgi:hypothetical protein